MTAITAVVALVASAYLLFLGIRCAPLPVQTAEIACAIGSVYCLFFCGLTLIVGRFQLFSFPGAFLGVSGLYTVGLLIAFAIHGDVAFAIWYIVDMEAILQGVPLVMLAFTSFFLGSVWAVMRPLPNRARVSAFSLSLDRQFVRYVGAMLFGGAVAIILVDTLRGAGLTYALEGGYHYLAEMHYQGGGLGLAWGALIWFLPWGVIILAASSNEKRDLLWLLPVILVANGILIIAGDRGGMFVLDLVLLMRATLLGFRIRWWQGLAIAVAIVVAIPTIMVLRQTASRNWTSELVLEALTFNSEGALGTDPVSATLIEGGLSYKILMGTVAMVPATEGFHLGADYVRSLAVAVPFLSRIFPDLVSRNDLWVKDYVEHPLSSSGIGFLQVAEAYVQFGAWGVLGFYLLAGFAVPYLWRCCVERQLSYCQLAYSLIIANTVLLWIRNEFHVVVKPVAWCFLLLLVLPKVLGGISLGRIKPKIAGGAGDLPAPAKDLAPLVNA